MEEDINILEDLMFEMKFLSINKETIRKGIAIENLIERVKQLEIIQEDYIPKSKVKEKIEEYDKQRIKMEKDDIGVGFTLGKEWSDLKAKLQVLQELLED